MSSFFQKLFKQKDLEFVYETSALNPESIKKSY